MARASLNFRLAACKRGTWLDHTAMALALTGYSMPVFWWALLLIMTFSVGMLDHLLLPCSQCSSTIS